MNITLTMPATLDIKGTSKAFLGPGRSPAALPKLPDGTVQIQDWIGLDYRDPETGEGIASAGYEIHFKGGPVLSGDLDKQGVARHDNVDRKEVLKVVYKPRPPDEDKPYPPLDELLG
jgi:type VI secretion system secreted protein VgrG